MLFLKRGSIFFFGCAGHGVKSAGKGSFGRFRDEGYSSFRALQLTDVLKRGVVFFKINKRTTVQTFFSEFHLH